MMASAPGSGGWRAPGTSASARDPIAVVRVCRGGGAAARRVHGPSKRDPAQLMGRTDGLGTVILPAGVGDEEAEATPGSACR
jgi:hypothetical protein